MGLQAHKQVVECRRILKWTYAYGYYKFDTLSLEGSNSGATSQADVDVGATKGEIEQRKSFFEFLQGDAEASLERLSDALEQKLTKFTSVEKFWRCRGGARDLVQSSALCTSCAVCAFICSRAYLLQCLFLLRISESVTPVSGALT
jgi:hypothetical protein